MTTAKNNTYIKLISLVLALITAASAFSLTSVTFEAASKPQTAYNAVAKAYGKAFPLKKSDVISSKKRLMGVRTADLKSYYAASKTVGGSKSKEEYLVFIAEVKDSSKVKSVKT
ncbi:MAG: hypothetical protein IKF64_04930, partial [Eubacterium sp.]|nr:hypothetical protein [Eubacterium sp.]